MMGELLAGIGGLMLGVIGTAVVLRDGCHRLQAELCVTQEAFYKHMRGCGYTTVPVEDIEVIDVGEP